MPTYNSNALRDAYSQFSSGGYSGSMKDFYSLLQSNPEALEDSFKLFLKGGYNGTRGDYEQLIGLKEEVKIEEVKEEEVKTEEQKIEEERKAAKTSTINKVINKAIEITPAYQLITKGSELYRKHFPAEEEEEVDEDERQKIAEENVAKGHEHVYRTTEDSYWNLIMGTGILPTLQTAGLNLLSPEARKRIAANTKALKMKWAGVKGFGVDVATGKITEKELAEMEQGDAQRLTESNYKNAAITKSSTAHGDDPEAQQTHIEERGRKSGLGLELEQDQELLQAIQDNDQEKIDKIVNREGYVKLEDDQGNLIGYETKSGEMVVDSKTEEDASQIASQYSPSTVQRMYREAYFDLVGMTNIINEAEDINIMGQVSGLGKLTNLITNNYAETKDAAKLIAEQGDLVAGLKKLPGNSQYAKRFNEKLMQFKTMNRALQLNIDPSMLEQEKIVYEKFIAPAFGKTTNDEYVASFNNLKDLHGIKSMSSVERPDDSFVYGTLLKGIAPKGHAIRDLVEGGTEVTRDLLPLIAEVAITKKVGGAGLRALGGVITRVAKSKSNSRVYKGIVDTYATVAATRMGALTGSMIKETAVLAGADIVAKELVEPMVGIEAHPFVINLETGDFTPTFAAALGAGNSIAKGAQQSWARMNKGWFGEKMAQINAFNKVPLVGTTFPVTRARWAQGVVGASAGTGSFMFANLVQSNLDQLTSKHGGFYTVENVRKKYLEEGYSPEEATEMAQGEYDEIFGFGHMAKTYIGMRMLGTLPKSNNPFGALGTTIEGMRTDILARKGSTIYSKRAAKLMGIKEGSSPELIEQVKEDLMSKAENETEVKKIEAAAEELHTYNDIAQAKKLAVEHGVYIDGIINTSLLGKKYISGQKLTPKEVEKFGELTDYEYNFIRAKLTEQRIPAEHIQRLDKARDGYKAIHDQITEQGIHGESKSKIMKDQVEFYDVISEVEALKEQIKENPLSEGINKSKIEKLELRREALSERMGNEFQSYRSKVKQKAKQYNDLMKVYDSRLEADGRYKLVGKMRYAEKIMERYPEIKTIEEALKYTETSEGFYDKKQDKIFINKFVQSRNMNPGVGMHEIIHRVLRNSLKNEGEVFLNKEGVNAVESFNDILKAKDPKAWEIVNNKIEINYKYDANGKKKPKEEYYEEYLTKYFDSLSSEQIKYNKTTGDILTDFVTPFVRKIPAYQNWRRGKKYTPQTGKDLYNLMRDFHKTAERGEVLERAVELGRRGPKMEPGEGIQEARFTSKEGFEINSLLIKPNGTRYTNAEWKRGGVDVEMKERIKNELIENGVDPDRAEMQAEKEASLGISKAYLDLIEGDKLHGVIMGGEVPIVGGKVYDVSKSEFIKKVKDEVSGALMRFSPEEAARTKYEGHNTLSGWLNFHIEKRKPGIIDKLKKDVLKFAKPIEPIKGEITKEYGVELETPETLLIAKEERAARKKLEPKITFRKEITKELGVKNELFENVTKVVTKTWSGKLPKITSKKLKSALAKDFRRELKKPIADMMGKGPKYIEFLEKFYKLKHHIPQKTWVRFEREVPRDKRIFTEVEIERMNVAETKKAIAEERVPKNTSLTAGNTLWKYKDPTPEQFKEFFQAIHTKSPSSSKGTRKTALAEEIGVELGLDATFDVLRSPAVISRRANVNELLKRETVENELEVIGKQIERNPSIQFCRDVQEKATQKVIDRFYGNRSEFINRIQEQGFTPKGIGRAFDIAYPEGIKAKDGKTSLKSDVVKDYLKLLKPWFAVDKRWKKVEREFPQTIEEYMITRDLGPENIAVRKYYEVGANVDYHRDPIQRKQYGEYNKDILSTKVERLAEKMFEGKKFDELNSTEKEAVRERAIVEAIRNKSYVEDAEISPDRRMVFYKSLSKKVKKQLKEGVWAGGLVKDYLSVIYPELVDYTKHKKNVSKGLPPRIELKFKDGTTKVIELPESSIYDGKQKISKEMVEDTMSDKEKELRKENADFHWDQLIETFEIASDLVKDSNTPYSKIEMSMLTSGFLGNMKTSLRAAALFRYAPINPPTKLLYDASGKKYWEYEHGNPAKNIALILSDHFFTGNKIDLAKLKESYSIGAIHRDFNKNISKTFGDRMQFDYRVGDIPPKRWYGMFTAVESTHAVRDIYTNTKYGVHQAAFWKRVKADTKKILKQHNALAKNVGISESKDIKKSSENLRIHDKAIADGRKLKEKKGMSAWDFDDTLAKTKSGVRYKLPNPDRSPQPGRKVIFLAGGPGSGKSTVIKGLELEKQGFKIVNQDISLQWLAKNHGLPKDMRDFTSAQASKWSELTWDARLIAKRKQTKFQGKGDGIVVDGTGNSLKTMNQHVREFKSKGYDVQMVFVETSLETALQRNRARKERSLRDGIVIKTHESVQKNKEAFKELFGNNFAEVKTDKLKIGDLMPADIVKKMDGFTKGYKKGRLEAGEFADKGEGILAKGGKFDFAEFDIVKEGEKGPLFGEAMERAKKFGLKDQFVLTARPHAAKISIFRFLAAKGLEIPFDNIITLENSSAKAKATWMLKKFSEGYNDMYFADDAIQNVKAVKDVLAQLDVKSKVQQVIQHSKERLNKDFNGMLEDLKGLPEKASIKDVTARMTGAKKGNWKWIIPPSAADFELLTSFTMAGKGKRGEAHKEWWDKHLFKPFARGINEINTAKQSTTNDYLTLRKGMPDVKKMLSKKVPNTNFTHDAAIRVHRWTEAGYEVPGLSKTDLKKLNDVVNNNPKLKAFSDQLGLISKQAEGWTAPTEHWLIENITADLNGINTRVNRTKYLAEWIENKNIIFSKANMNKIEYLYGTKHREALEDMLYRMEKGTNRRSGMNKLTNRFMNWTNNSVGAIMFLNMRSAGLQLLSSVNYVNWAENNPLKAAKAFANQKQYWKDFATIYNSDMLKQRRAGLKMNVNEAEIAAAVEGSSNKAQAALSWLLKKGFTPTQIADSFAISSGGATFYRNRIKMYEKQGIGAKEAREKAWTDFQEIAEKTQQSARPDLISQQQASPLGRLILAFANTPMQYARIMKKSAMDLASGRGSAKSHVSRILFYGGIQSLIFASLQSGMFAMLFDDQDEDYVNKKQERVANTMVDGLLRGVGVTGATIAAIKNGIIRFMHENDKDYNADYMNAVVDMINISPTIGSKVRKLKSAGDTYKWNKEVMKEMGLDIDNPALHAIGNVVSATTNIPLDRLVTKINNLKGASDAELAVWQRIAQFMGYNRWDLGMDKPGAVIEAKEKIKEKKKEKAKFVQEIKKESRIVEEQIEINAQVEQEKILEEKGLLVDPKCSSVKSGGERCDISVSKAGDKCTVHESVVIRESGKKTQCKKVKADGKRCKVQTPNKSGLCYYHD